MENNLENMMEKAREELMYDDCADTARNPDRVDSAVSILVLIRNSLAKLENTPEDVDVAGTVMALDGVIDLLAFD